jgi:hypothetical protein
MCIQLDYTSASYQSFSDLHVAVLEWHILNTFLAENTVKTGIFCIIVESFTLLCQESLALTILQLKTYPELSGQENQVELN